MTVNTSIVKTGGSRPRDADDGLLVAHGEVAPRESIEQFPETPRSDQIDVSPGRLDNTFVNSRKSMTPPS
jgi:hypothetical protein